MRPPLLFLLLAATMLLSACSTLSNRRDLFAPRTSDASFESVVHERSSSAFDEVFRERYQRKLNGE